MIDCLNFLKIHFCAAVWHFIFSLVFTWCIEVKVPPLLRQNKTCRNSQQMSSNKIVKGNQIVVSKGQPINNSFLMGAQSHIKLYSFWLSWFMTCHMESDVQIFKNFVSEISREQQGYSSYVVGAKARCTDIFSYVTSKHFDIMTTSTCGFTSRNCRNL